MDRHHRLGLEHFGRQHRMRRPHREIIADRKARQINIKEPPDQFHIPKQRRIPRVINRLAAGLDNPPARLAAVKFRRQNCWYETRWS